MESLLLDLQTRELLLRCWEWRVISTLLPPDVPPVGRQGHEDLLAAAANHRHPYRQILFFLRGAGHVVLQGVVYPVAPRSVFFADALELHGERALESADLVFLRVNLRHGQFGVRLFRDEMGFRTSSAEGERVLATDSQSIPIEAQWADLTARRELGRALIRARLLAATALLVAAILDDSGTDTSLAGEFSRREAMSSIAEHLRHTAGRGATVRQLAEASGYSVCHFTRLFREHTGLSVHQFIDRCRIERFHQLSRTGHSKKQIAAALGFATQSAFSHWLKTPRLQPLLSLQSDWSCSL